MVVIGLPRYALLKSKQNKNRLVSPSSDDGSLRAIGEDATSPSCKFEIEMAETGDGLVHIRSCYNNRYWVRQYGSTGADGWNDGVSDYLIAGADVPNEDRNSRACTLFLPVRDEGDAKTLQLRMLPSNEFVALSPWGPRSKSRSSSSAAVKLEPLFALCLDPIATKPRTSFIVLDWESFLILPKRVVFKGDNGKYLQIEHRNGHPWVKFYGEELGHQSASNEIALFSNFSDLTDGPDGSVHIKSDDNGKFWRRSPNWIWADSNDDPRDNQDTLFMPVKAGAGNSVIALRSLGNNKFCKRLTTDGWVDCLNADTPTVTTDATLSVEEPVFSRSIYNVRYRLADARVYNESVITMVSKVIVNNNTEPETHEVSLSYTKTTSTTFDRGVSVNTSVTTSFTAGIPIIAGGEIEVSASVEGSWNWSDTEETSEEIETTQTLTVPPKSTVTTSVLATKGTCDVPFSYTQRDVLTSGDSKIYDMDDGLYTGINSYNFHYETSAPGPL